jgi:hypothetical protein
MKTKITLIALGLSLSLAKAQAPYWKLNGNPNAGPDVVTAANNFFGTATGNNIPVRFGTDGANQMFLQNGTGFFGIGPGFVAPLSLLHVNELGKGGIATGNLFRTDGTSTLDNLWQLFTGATNNLT